MYFIYNRTFSHSFACRSLENSAVNWRGDSLEQVKWDAYYLHCDLHWFAEVKGHNVIPMICI